MAEGSVRTPAVPWTVRDVLMGLGLVVGGAVLGLTLLILLTSEDGIGEGDGFATLALGSLQGLMVAAVWLFGVKKYRASWRLLGFSHAQGRWSLFLPWVAFLGSLLFGGLYGTIVTVAGIDSLVPPPVPADALGEGPVRVMNFLMIGGLGPLTEELFFRGFVLAALVGAWGVLPGAIASLVSRK